MKYIVHRRCREMGAAGQQLNLSYGSVFETIGHVIATPEGKAVCFENSDVAHKYFARNDDDRGLLRGRFTYAIAWSDRVRLAGGRRQRFTGKEIEMLERDWERFLVPDVPVILFNHPFFVAEIDELEQLARALNIRIKSKRQRS